MNEIRHPHLKIKICVSGATETGHCGIDALEIGKELGREIVRHVPFLSPEPPPAFLCGRFMGAKEEGGISVGISPAQTELEHVEKYKLPLEYMDLIMYTPAPVIPTEICNSTATSDAVIAGCGRIGTLNEFTIAFEDNKPIGVLEGDWTTDELIKKILDESHRGNGKVVYDKDPKKLVEKIIELVNKEKVQTIKCPGCI